MSSTQDKAMQVSLVIPIRNEAASLRELIRSINAQTRPPDEIILVDGGSTDATVDVARELTADDQRYCIIEAGLATPGRGRNLGVSSARFEWIAFTDAGIRLESTWLERLVAAAETDPDVEVVFGNYEPIVNSWFERCAALTYVPPKVRRSCGPIRSQSVVSSLLKKQVWVQVGGFPDLRAAEDLIFMERIYAAEFKIKYAPAATVWWTIQPNLRKTFRRFALYSFHTARIHRHSDWHYGVARQYVVAFLFLFLAIVHSPWWCLILFVGFSARILKSVYKNRNEYFYPRMPSLLVFLGVAIILLTLDLATFIGWFKAARSPKLSPSS